MRKGVLVGSTGVIGMQIPIDKIKAGIYRTCQGERKLDLASGTEAAKAIMTTDTKKKEVAVTFMAGDTDSNDRRNGERFRNDSSEYVYNACIYYNGCKNFQKSTSGGNEQ